MDGEAAVITRLVQIHVDWPRLVGGVETEAPLSLSVLVETERHPDSRALDEDTVNKLATLSILAPVPVRVGASPRVLLTELPLLLSVARVEPNENDTRQRLACGLLDPIRVRFPPLWAASYRVCCDLYEAVTFTTCGRLVGSLEAGPLIVGPDPRFPRQPQSLPIEVSNLTAVIAHSGANSVRTRLGEVPFTLTHTGYPVLDMQRGVGAYAPGVPVYDIEARLRSAIEVIEDSIVRHPVSGQLFSPIFAKDARPWNDQPVLPRSGDGVPEPARENSHRLSGVAQGTMLRVESADDSGEYSLGQAVKSALEALQWDPENFSAYLWVARASAHRGDWGLAFDFYLTLAFRMRLAERILGEGARDAESKWLVHLVERAARRHLGPYFRSHLENTAALLCLNRSLDLRFPRLMALSPTQTS